MIWLASDFADLWLYNDERILFLRIHISLNVILIKLSRPAVPFIAYWYYLHRDLIWLFFFLSKMVIVPFKLVDDASYQRLSLHKALVGFWHIRISDIGVYIGLKVSIFSGLFVNSKSLIPHKGLYLICSIWWTGLSQLGYHFNRVWKVLKCHWFGILSFAKYCHFFPICIINYQNCQFAP